MIILDEVFGSQDLERRGTLLEYLGRLEEEFEQIFVISHFDDVTAASDVQFEVRKTPVSARSCPSDVEQRLFRSHYAAAMSQ